MFVLIYTPANSSWAFKWLHILTNTWWLFNCNLSGGCVVISHGDLSLCYLITKMGKHILIRLLAVQVSSFMKCLFMPCSLFFYWVVRFFFFFLLICRWSLCVLETGPSSLYAVQYLLLACLLVFFMTSFDQYQFLILLWLNLEIFSFTVCGVCILFNKIVSTLRSYCF